MKKMIQLLIVIFSLTSAIPQKTTIATTATSQQNNSSANNQGHVKANFSLSDYDFIAPQGWQVQNNKDHILIQNMQSGCVIRILEPQPFGGDLEQNAKAVFELMYKGWQYQKSGEQQYTLSKGFLPKGLEYYMMEAAMSATSTDGRYHLEEGAGLVVKAGNQLVIISVRHNSSLFAHDDCWKKYETWRRFFNSFTVKNAAVPRNNENFSKQIIGVWTNSGGGVLMDYTFAANGNYQHEGGYGTQTITSDYYYTYIHTKASTFQGDGRYSITGNQVTIQKRSQSKPEKIRVRFEKVNKGGTGWTDRIYMLKQSITDGKEYEVTYERRKL